MHIYVHTYDMIWMYCCTLYFNAAVTTPYIMYIIICMYNILSGKISRRCCVLTITADD